MKFLECPKCGQKATSSSSMMNPYFWYSSKKLCEKCHNGIKLNFTTIIWFYTSVLVTSFVSFLFVLKYYSFLLFGVWAIFVMSLNFIIPYILVRFFEQNLFLSNTDRQKWYRFARRNYRFILYNKRLKLTGNDLVVLVKGRAYPKGIRPAAYPWR